MSYNTIIDFCSKPSKTTYNKISGNHREFMHTVSQFIIKYNIGNIRLAYRIKDYYQNKFGNKRLMGIPVASGWRSQLPLIDTYYYDIIPDGTSLFRGSKNDEPLKNRATYFALEIGNANQYLPVNINGFMGIYKTNKELRLFRLDDLDNINSLLAFFFKRDKKMYENFKRMFVSPLVELNEVLLNSKTYQEEDGPIQLKDLIRASDTKVDFKFANWLCEQGFDGYSAGIMERYSRGRYEPAFPEEIMLCKPVDNVLLIKEMLKMKKSKNRDKLDDILTEYDVM